MKRRCEQIYGFSSPFGILQRKLFFAALSLPTSHSDHEKCWLNYAIITPSFSPPPPLLLNPKGGGVQCDSCHLPPFQTGITLDLSHLIAFTSPPPVELPPLSTSHTVPPNHERRVMSRSTEKRRGGGVDRHTDKVIGDGAILSPQRERGVKSQTSRGFITRFIASGTWDAQSRLEKRYSTDIVEVFFSRVKRSPSPGHVCGKK